MFQYAFLCLFQCFGQGFSNSGKCSRRIEYFTDGIFLPGEGNLRGKEKFGGESLLRGKFF